MIITIVYYSLLFNFRFAFVEFESEEDTESAMKSKQGSDLNGYSIFIDFTGNKAKGGRSKNIEESVVPGKKLFVKNLSFNTTEESLKELFEGANTVRIAKYPDSGKSRGLVHNILQLMMLISIRFNFYYIKLNHNFTDLPLLNLMILKQLNHKWKV